MFSHNGKYIKGDKWLFNKNYLNNSYTMSAL